MVRYAVAVYGRWGSEPYGSYKSLDEAKARGSALDWGADVSLTAVAGLRLVRTPHGVKQ
jgi:hypothetical protein